MVTNGKALQTGSRRGAMGKLGTLLSFGSHGCWRRVIWVSSVGRGLEGYSTPQATLGAAGGKCKAERNRLQSQQAETALF